MVIKTGRQGMDFDENLRIRSFFSWRIFLRMSQPDPAKPGAPNSRKTIFEIDEIPNLLHPGATFNDWRVLRHVVAISLDLRRL